MTWLRNTRVKKSIIKCLIDIMPGNTSAPMIEVLSTMLGSADRASDRDLLVMLGEFFEGATLGDFAGNLAGYLVGTIERDFDRDSLGMLEDNLEGTRNETSGLVFFDGELDGTVDGVVKGNVEGESEGA